jgi:hypothetical protein
MARGTYLALGKELAGQLLVQVVGLLLIDSGQRGSADKCGAQLVERLAAWAREIADDIPKTGTA